MDPRGTDDPRGRQQAGDRPPPSGTPTYGSHTPWMEGTTAPPYYAAAAGHPGVGQQPPTYGRHYPQQPYVDPAMAASMYARQYPAYGYAPPPPGTAGGADRYGYAPSHHHEMYMRHVGIHPPPRGQMGAHTSPHSSVPSSASKNSPSNATMDALATASAAQTTTKTPSKSSINSNFEGETPNSKSGSDPKTPATFSSFGGSTASPKSPSKKEYSAKPKKKAVAHEVTELEDLHIDKWYSGSIPLGLEDDKYWLSELQVYLRANFAEAFGATEEDIAAPMHGRNKPIALGQVGIRCVWCKNESPAERGQQAISYPSLISGIYNSVQQMLRQHLDCCQSMPPDVRTKIEALKMSSSSRGGRKQYWIDSAKRLGLVDTRHGIHFGRDPYGPLPPLVGPSVNTKEGKKKKESQKKAERPHPEREVAEIAEEEPVAAPPVVDDRPLVFPVDQYLISDYLYLTLEQMSPCVLMEADRVGCYKGRKVGFPGLACKWCVGQAGCGRYFPASEASLSQTTTSQTIMNHVRNCRRCPLEIRENLELMKRARMGPDGRRADKPKHGGRKVFFHRLWCRIQGLPIDDSIDDGERKKSGPKPKKKAKDSKHGDGSSSEEETDADSSDDSEDETGKTKQGGKGSKASGKNKFKPWCDGCVRLTKPDDGHWLSEMQCFARSDLVEVFAWRPKNGLAGYSGRKEPTEGQVAVRCAFCKSLPEEERPSGTLVFPDMVDDIQTKVEDMLRLHFHSCPGMPIQTKDTLKTLKNFGPKKGEDPHQYWIDSARDIGLSNLPPGNTSGWGITFRRDPLQPSPCDDLDRELEDGNSPPDLSKLYLIRPEDRGECTDQVFLMMRQVKVCRFQQRDRRGGSSSRGRDRVLDFPGLSCKHCADKNNIGRYFPVSAKNLTDNTANSLLSHVSSCSRCPETIKASLAYLSHRAILQKAELSGSWKKSLFKKIWDRLHNEKEWIDVIEAEEQEGESIDAADSQEGTAALVGDSEEDRESGDGQASNSMNALIKAAAIWLTKDEKTKDGSSVKSSRGRNLPGKKRGSEKSPSRGKKEDLDDEFADGGSKRRKVAV